MDISLHGDNEERGVEIVKMSENNFWSTTSAFIPGTYTMCCESEKQKNCAKKRNK
jgi:hypothetical protein